MVKYTAADLFCGIGGFRCALDSIGAKTVFSSDIDKFAQATYEANFKEIPFGDIRSVDYNKIPAVDIVTAGFPCQPFSYAGAKKGFEDTTRGTLFFDVLKFIQVKRPKMFLLENVKGLKGHDKGKTLTTIVNALENEGYSIYWKILNSYDFGLPQYRERWYCVGFDKKIDFKFPIGKERKVTLRSIIDLKDKTPSLKLTDFELERINYHFDTVSEDNPRVQHDNSKYKVGTKKGKHGVFSFQKPDGALRFHVGDFAKTQIQEAFYCCLDTYAPTIIANRVPKLWDIGRKLSVNEARKLQGFPSGFKFPVSAGQAYKQLGNAVSVPVVTAILEKMKELYEKA